MEKRDFTSETALGISATYGIETSTHVAAGGWRRHES
jgi:hypothetical protein